MILTRTPFRITLGGGGTDLPAYYEQYGGFVFAMGLNKYMYIVQICSPIDPMIRLHYRRSEEASHVSQLQHDLAREGLRRHGFETGGILISSLADIPAGTGFGSSSCYLVGLLNALHAYRRDFVSLQQLAEEACDIELNVLKKGIGKQDQYMAAFGGLTTLEIARDGQVKVDPVPLGESALAELIANTHLYYTGTRREAPEILADQNEALLDRGHARRQVVTEGLHRIKDLGYRSRDAIAAQDFDAWGQLLDEHWQWKKMLSDKISKTEWNALYDEARANYHVLGGKLIGAGGGGFLMLYCTAGHRKLEDFMAGQGMQRLHYGCDLEGTKVVANLPT